MNRTEVNELARDTLQLRTAKQHTDVTCQWSKHVQVENIGAKCPIAIYEHADDGEITAAVRLVPGESAQFTPTARHSLSVVLLDE
jgi:ferredoxin-like protein FixX